MSKPKDNEDEPKDNEDDEAIGLLAATEAAILRMTAGMFRFVFVQIPTWIYELGKNFFILHAARSETSSNSWKLRVMRVASLSA